MLPLILNSNNVVDNGNNDTMIYKFPAGAVTFNRNVIAISSISLYFSWFNITSATTNSEYNNNSYEYVWYGSTGASTYTVTMPDGYYEISDINAYLQSVLVSNGHYLTDSSGNYVYYLQLEVNQTEYAVQFNSYPIPSSLPSGYSNPASMSFPSADTTPQITILSTNNFPFEKIFTYANGFCAPCGHCTFIKRSTPSGGNAACHSFENSVVGAFPSKITSSK